jgi:hypothetical protein
MGTSLVKNPNILVEETVRSTAVGTFRISQKTIFVRKRKILSFYFQSIGFQICVQLGTQMVSIQTATEPGTQCKFVCKLSCG